MSKIHYIVSVEGAIYRDDKWLIIRRSEQEECAPGRLALVGGKVENVSNVPANVLEETLKREVREEVGITIDVVDYLKSKAFVMEDGQTVIDVIFLCKHKSGEPRCASPDEVATVRWLTAQEIENSDKAPLYLKKSIAEAETMRLNRGEATWSIQETGK